MDPQHIAAFNRARTSEYLTVEENCKKLNKFIEDYEAVKLSLLSLSEKCKHPVMVPFGNVAFMSGSLVHTNDVLVLLGDNWFVEQSTKQTVDILSRRVTALQTQVDKLQTRMRGIKTELSYAKELAEDSSDKVEIIEPYDEQFEQGWKIQHDASMRKYRHETKQSNTVNVPDRAETDSTEYERILRRLQQLEEEEEEEEEEEKEGNIDEEVKVESSAEREPNVDQNDSFENVNEYSRTLVINFKHTAAGSQIRERHVAICSPADVYDRFCVQFSSATSHLGAADSDCSEKTSDVSSSTADSKLRVLEDITVSCRSEMPQSSVETDMYSSASEPTVRKMSKFKASRLKK